MPTVEPPGLFEVDLLYLSGHHSTMGREEMLFLTTRQALMPPNHSAQLMVELKIPIVFFREDKISRFLPLLEMAELPLLLLLHVTSSVSTGK